VKVRSLLKTFDVEWSDGGEVTQGYTAKHMMFPGTGVLSLDSLKEQLEETVAADSKKRPSPSHVEKMKQPQEKKQKL